MNLKSKAIDSRVKALPGQGPQKSKSKNATPRRVYGPAARVSSRKAQLETAKALGPVEYYGPAHNGLMGAEHISFDSYLREIHEALIGPTGSEQNKLRQIILQDGACRESDKKSRAYLKKLCSRLASEKQQPTRYFQNVVNSLWNAYVGLLKGRRSNSRAITGEEKRLEKRVAYQEREKLRLKARRDIGSRQEKLTQQIARLNQQQTAQVEKAEEHAKKAVYHRAKYESCLQKAHSKKARRDALAAELKALKVAS